MPKKTRKAKARKIKGGWNLPLGDSKGVSYSESRESKRKRIMAERVAKQRAKEERKERERQAKLAKIKRQTEVAEAIAKKRSADRRARQAHPLWGLKVPKIRGKKRRITMF